MSRTISLVAALSVAVLLTACGGGTVPEDANSAPAGAETGAPAEPIVPEEPEPTAAPEPSTAPVADVDPVLVVETVKGTFEIQTYPDDAPMSVAHILELVRRRFYNGQRIHRKEPGFVVQFGDPYSRDMSRPERWGTGGSGGRVGVSEAKRPHGVGAVALAHSGDPRGADSQMYVTLAAAPNLDRDFTVFGQVVSGMDVVRTLEVADVIRSVTLKE
jgi:cyclophilin family peptidyl-prolyl cis-trans isomerase